MIYLFRMMISIANSYNLPEGIDYIQYQLYDYMGLSENKEPINPLINYH